MNRIIYVNEAFRPQRVSGQQRYAAEMSNRLPALVRRVVPGRFWSAGTLRTWLWVQTVLPVLTCRGVLISLTARAPLWHPRHVLVVHDLFVIEHPEWFSRQFHLTHAPLLRFQLATARCLVAVSDPVAEEISARRPRATVVVAPNAPSAVFAGGVGSSGVEQEAVLSRFGLLAGGYLMVVGNLDPRKNLVALAAAYGLLSSEQRSRLPLVVVGGGADIYRQSHIDWPSGTVVTGYLDDVTLASLYAHARVFVFTSLAEGFGLPIVEAVLAGVPRLVLSDIPVFRWICGDGARYVDPRSVEALAAALDPARIEDIPPPDAAIPARFDWSRSAGMLYDASREVAAT